MVLTNKVAFILGAALAVANAVIAILVPGHEVVAVLQGIAIVLGAFGVQQLSPKQIAAKISAHTAAIASGALTAVNMAIQNIALPVWAHALVGSVFAAAAALGIVVTGVAVSKGAKTQLTNKAAARRAARLSNR